MAAGVLVLALVTAGSTRVAASELLQNGDFASWTAGDPDGWAVAPPGSASYDESCGCARLTGSAVSITQYVAAEPGATYAARVTVAPGVGLAEVSLVVTFLDGSLFPIAGGAFVTTVPIGGEPVVIESEPVAPAGAAYAEYRVQVAGDDEAVAFVSGASLTMTAQATPTPSPTDTPTATPARDTSTAQPSSSATASATKSPTPTKTATPTRTATPPKSQTPTRTPTPTKTPRTSGSGTPPPGTNSGPVLDDGSGGLLANGGFERVRDNAPVGWSKYGGTLVSAGFGAYEGSWAAALVSMTLSTKWVHQVAPVAAGEWYRGTAMAKLTSGKGEIFIRMSWYASYDGSGTLISQVDSNIATGYDWTLLDTGAVQAPATAKSVRFRLMLRPLEPATAMYDAAVLVSAAAPTPTPSPTEAPATPTPEPQVPATTPAAAATASPTARSTGGSPGEAGTAPDNIPPVGATWLRLSELMPDPPEAGNDAAYEWVEIVNTGTSPASTAGWQIGDAQATDAIPETTIEPGGYLVIAGPGAAFSEGIPVVRVADGRIGNGLNNNGDLVRLIAPGGTLVDSMSYGENTAAFDPPPAAPGAGETLGVREPGGVGGENWARTRLPTPGGPNLFDEAGPDEATPAQSPAAPSRTPSLESDTRPAREAVSPAITEAGESSIVPWLLLAAAGGAGAVGASMAARRAAPRILERVWRRRGN